MDNILFGPVIDLVRELIPDGDKRKELEAKIETARIETDRMILTTTTTPKVDAFVKVLFALERFIGTLWRPIGSAAMTAFGAYAHYKGIQIDTGLQAMLDGAFPAWGVSRHVEKARNTEPRDPTAKGSKR